MDKTSINHNTANDGNMLLSAGFFSLREAKRFSKMYTLLTIIHTQLDSLEISAEIVSHLQVEWAYKELEKMKLPDGYQKLSTLDDLLTWFFKTCR